MFVVTEPIRNFVVVQSRCSKRFLFPFCFFFSGCLRNAAMSSSLEKRLEVIQTEDGDPTCITFVLKEEDHTLGNALRYVINQNPDVDFCGYAIPHPSERKVNLRIQTKGAPAADVFKKGLEDLLKICDHVTETFKEAQQAYDERREEEINEKLEAMHAD